MLRQHFEREVEYLWSRLEWAARAHGALASLWGRDADARVGRLVASAAYAFARVKEKLEDDLPELSHALVAGALPEVLRPYPSTTILRMSDPNRARRNAVEQAVRRVESRPVDGVPCVFQTVWPLVTGPVVLANAVVRTRERDTQVLVLRLEAYGGIPLVDVLPDPLRIFVRAQQPGVAIDVVHALHRSIETVEVRGLGEDGRERFRRNLPVGTARCTALAGEFRSTPGPSDRFSSSTLLRALAHSPEMFGFFDLVGLSALRGVAPGVRALEVSVRLSQPVAGTEALGVEDFCLDCTPAANVFAVDGVPVVVRHGTTSGLLAVPGRPGSDVFHVTSANFKSDDDPDRARAVPLWERPEARSAGGADGLYVQLERRSAIEGGRSDVLARLVTLARGPTRLSGELQFDLLVTDGRRTDGLLPGDVVMKGEAANLSNITRVTSSRPATFEGSHTWRANAYARMPLSRLARSSQLAAFLELHSSTHTGDQHRAVTPASLGVLSVARTRTHRVLGPDVEHGDAVDLALDETHFGGAGTTWLVGECLARALAERTDMLRFARARLVGSDNRLLCDYGDRVGSRLPPPFG